MNVVSRGLHWQICYCETWSNSHSPAGVTLQHMCVCGSRITRPDSSLWLPGFNRVTEQRSHLAASPPGRRFDTLGLPSLSDPPEMVRPRLLPSLFIRSTVVTPLYSSAGKYTHRHRSTVSISVCLTESPRLRGNERLFFFIPLSWISHRNALWHTTTYFIFSLSCPLLVPSHLSIWVNLCDGFRRRRRMESVLWMPLNCDDGKRFNALLQERHSLKITADSSGHKSKSNCCS